MKFPLSIAFFLAFCFSVAAQNPVATDTTIYEVSETLPYPLLKSCLAQNRSVWTPDSIRRCGEMQLLALMSSNIRYPQEARDQNIQGTVVLTFVVEPTTGRISRPTLLRDIGGGCGEEAMRVLRTLDEAGLRWAPATQGGKPVRVKHSLPIRFKLAEALPYYVSERGDSVYTVFDNEANFKPGNDSLVTYLINRLNYPKQYIDSCKVGIIEMALLIRPNGTVNVENVLDFSNLGLDFQWEAIRLANRTSGTWNPARYETKPVASTLPLRVLFKSDATGCKTRNDKFDQAMLLADEGANLFEQDKADEAIQKWSKALEIEPDNCELLYYRGTALLNQNKKEEACKDYNRVKAILGITWFENIRRLVCGW